MVSLQQHIIKTPYMIGPVHCYSGELAGELVLFDAGPPTEEAKNYFREYIDLQRLKHVVITHCHIDHYGLASWFEENSKATIYLPYQDSVKFSNHDRQLFLIGQLLSELGFDEQYLTDLKKIFNSRSMLPCLPHRYKIVEKDLPEHLKIDVLSCPGHSQSDLVYVGKDWAVTGDTLIKGVFQTPLLDVDLSTGRRFKNYQVYCESIIKLSSLRGKTVLSAHRRPVTSVDEVLVFYISRLLQRIKQLNVHREEENLQIIVEKLLDDKMQEPMHIYLKASEIMFMKDFLKQPELLMRSTKKIGLWERLSKLFQAALEL